jgi:hypothetical protein
MTKPVRIEDEEDVKSTGPESKTPVHSGSFSRSLPVQIVVRARVIMATRERLDTTSCMTISRVLDCGLALFHVQDHREDTARITSRYWGPLDYTTADDRHTTPCLFVHLTDESKGPWDP